MSTAQSPNLSGQNFNSSGTQSAVVAWVLNQSGLVVSLFLGLAGLYWIGRAHIGELKEMWTQAQAKLSADLAEEKKEAKEERKEFRDVLKACCEKQSQPIGAFSTRP